MRAGWLVLVAVVAAGCGGGSKQNVPGRPPPALATRCGDDVKGVEAKQVWFRASDNALLDGAAVGDGDVGVVLAHEYPSDLCPWLPFAKTLAGHGYRAFALDLRGSGASPARFGAEATRYDRDVQAASDEVRRLGAKKVFLVGASLGGAAVLKAAPSLDPLPAGVISLSGEPQLLDASQSAPRLKAPLLVLIARRDGYSSVADNRRLVRAAASVDKQLAVYPGDWHGWDLLYDAPYKRRVNALVFEFLSKHSQ
jgi:alpha-beta hydrolase superfamily lysophospholipase